MNSSKSNGNTNEIVVNWLGDGTLETNVGDCTDRFVDRIVSNEKKSFEKAKRDYDDLLGKFPLPEGLPPNPTSREFDIAELEQACIQVDTQVDTQVDCKLPSCYSTLIWRRD